MRTFLTPEELAEYLRLPSVQTVYRWRTTGYGPAASKIGKHVRYDLADVDAWVDAQKEAA